MVPTFVIGLREGLEAALIVGIIAAFLGQRGERRALRRVWVGVGLAVGLCAIVAVVLDVVAARLPQKQQEGLETVVGSIAVVMVGSMILWMRSHSAGLKRELEGAASKALATGSATALVGMAFLAVLREGFETAVFLLATFEASHNPLLGGLGALLGVLVAVVVGWGIYRGGVRLNLGRFFRITGIVLVFVAAGLVASAFGTAAEAGWLPTQRAAFDLSWLVRPGTPLSSLITGVLGIPPYPTWTQVIAWLVFTVPMLLLVGMPRRRSTPRPTASATGTASAGGPAQP